MAWKISLAQGCLWVRVKRKINLKLSCELLVLLILVDWLQTSLVLCAPLPQLLPVACRAILPYVYIMYQTNIPCQPFLERFKRISMVIDWVRNLRGFPHHLPLFVQVVISLGRFAVNCFEKKGETHWITLGKGKKYISSSAVRVSICVIWAPAHVFWLNNQIIPTQWVLQVCATCICLCYALAY